MTVQPSLFAHHDTTESTGQSQHRARIVVVSMSSVGFTSRSPSRRVVASSAHTAQLGGRNAAQGFSDVYGSILVHPTAGGMPSESRVHAESFDFVNRKMVHPKKMTRPFDFVNRKMVHPKKMTRPPDSLNRLTRPPDPLTLGRSQGTGHVGNDDSHGHHRGGATEPAERSCATQPLGHPVQFILQLHAIPISMSQSSHNTFAGRVDRTWQ